MTWLVWLLACITCTPPHPPAPASGQTTILVSLDGFRWDYIDRPQAVNLRALAARGVRARRMVPAFPSKTFPNHYTMVTGLYPEHSGIISNTMWDDVIGKTFTMSARDVMVDPRWWGGEPLWVTAVKNGKKSASFFWPGSDVAIGGVLPTYYRVYDGRIRNATRVRSVLEWLVLPADSAPLFITMYMSDVDHAGHEFGPDAPQADSAIAHVDSMVGALVSGIAAAGLTDRVNVVIVADHGMVAVSPDRQIFLDDYIDLAQVTVVDWSPVASIRPRQGYEDSVYARLKTAHPQLAVYRKADIPARLHYQASPRITPIVAIAADGWYIARRSRPLRETWRRSWLRQRPSFYGRAVRGCRTGVQARRRGRAVSERPRVRAAGADYRAPTGAANDGSLDSVRALLR